MNFQTTAQPYFRQALFDQNKSYRSSDMRLLFATTKLLLVVILVLMAVTFYLTSISASLVRSVDITENMHRDCIKSQLHLLDKRIQLYSSEQVQQRAGETLSLYLPEKEQVQLL